MTDRMLSAEKVKAWAQSKHIHAPVYGSHVKINTLILELVGAIECGQLDADRQDIESCGDKTYLDVELAKRSR